MAVENVPSTAFRKAEYQSFAVAETTCTPFQSEPDAAPVRLIVRRVKPTPCSQLALFTSYSYHGFITDREGETLELEADHRRHAEIENAIRDLKYGVGLNHMPSGCFAANGAWLAYRCRIWFRPVAQTGVRVTRSGMGSPTNWPPTWPSSRDEETLGPSAYGFGKSGVPQLTNPPGWWWAATSSSPG